MTEPITWEEYFDAIHAEAQGDFAQGQRAFVQYQVQIGTFATGMRKLPPLRKVTYLERTNDVAA